MIRQIQRSINKVIAEFPVLGVTVKGRSIALIACSMGTFWLRNGAIEPAV